MNRETLYHYTDFMALDGILSNRELRVNNVLNMNDAQEMELFMTGIFRAAIERLEKSGREDKARKLSALYEEEKKKFFEYSVYAACFSEYRDDAAQWDRYAYRGKGVCFGMKKAILEKMTGGAVSLQKVFYRDDMDSHPLVTEICTLVQGSDDVSVENGPLKTAVLKAWQNCASFKHPSFSSEREYRLVVMPFEAEDFSVKPRYHVARERIKKYYPLDLHAMCVQAGSSIEELVTEIIIGPESTQSIPILKDYLKDIGLPALAGKVVHSDCPLRSKI